MRKQRAIVIVAATTILLGPLATPVLGAPVDPHGPAGSKFLISGPRNAKEADRDAMMMAQTKLDRAADAIRAAGEGNGSGFAGDAIDAGTTTVTVYWHGEVPTMVTTKIESIRRTGVAVEVRSARFPLAQLLTESSRLVRTVKSVSGRSIVSAGPLNDGSGVEVGINSGGTVLDSSNAKQLAKELTDTVPLTIVSQPMPVAANRFADSSPYWGGAYGEIFDAQNNVQGACTTGFGVAGNNGAARYLLTAAHCGVGQWRTGGGTVFGNVIPTRDLAHDAELVLTSSGSAIYDGPSIATGDTITGRVITGASTSRVGDTICAGGSFSGTLCGFRVAAVNQTVNVGGFGTVTNLVRAEAPNHASGIGNGDSGGPVYAISGAGGVARGTITAYSGDMANWVTCAGVPNGPNNDPNARHCAWQWWYPDVTVQIATLGVHFE